MWSHCWSVLCSHPHSQEDYNYQRYVHVITNSDCNNIAIGCNEAVGPSSVLLVVLLVCGVVLIVVSVVLWVAVGVTVTHVEQEGVYDCTYRKL